VRASGPASARSACFAIRAALVLARSVNFREFSARG
jgi:hypothetical protein